MRVVIDNGVFIRWEREGGIIEFSRWSSLCEPCISVISESELTVGIHRCQHARTAGKAQSLCSDSTLEFRRIAD
jgi:hypothetical protein